MKPMTNNRPQTIGEEIANAITHGFGILFALLASPFLIMEAFHRGTTQTVWAVSMFSFGMLMVYLSSTIYHAVQHHHIKRKLRILDHISIFFLIGGSYSAVVQKFTDSHTATIFLTVMWSIIGLGTLMKLFFTGKYNTLSTGLYLGLGWMAIFLIKPLYANLPLDIFLWLLAGGMAYSLGVIFFVNDRLKYWHSIWHLFVLAGTITHFVAVYSSLSLNLNV